MYTVYRAYGLHIIRDETDKEFEKTKKFNKMVKRGTLWIGGKHDVFAWKKEEKEVNINE